MGGCASARRMCVHAHVGRVKRVSRSGEERDAPSLVSGNHVSSARPDARDSRNSERSHAWLTAIGAPCVAIRTVRLQVVRLSDHARSFHRRLIWNERLLQRVVELVEQPANLVADGLADCLVRIADLPAIGFRQAFLAEASPVLPFASMVQLARSTPRAEHDRSIVGELLFTQVRAACLTTDASVSRLVSRISSR